MLAPAVVYDNLPKIYGNTETDEGYASDTVRLQDYTERIKTYTNWPNKCIEAAQLAKAGFYYLNKNDIVKCPFCSVEGHAWKEQDDPMSDHKNWSPTCPFVRSPDSPTLPTGQDTCGNFGVEILPNSVPEQNGLSQLEKIGVKRTKGPSHPEYVTYESRLKSFAIWPKSMKQKPDALAEAGFFYLGGGDQTICFYCGGGLKDWEEDDDPWQQHAMWFFSCHFLFMKKGKEYIKQVREQKTAELSAPSTSSNTPSTSRSSVSTKTTSASTKRTKNVKAKEKVETNNCTVVTNNITSKETNTESSGEKTICKICYKNEVGVVFLPCGHVLSCVDCAPAFPTCPVCRQPVEATYRAFVS